MVTVKALIVCHHAHGHPDTGRVTILDMFHTLRADTFPSKARDFEVWVWLAGTPEDRGTLKLVCREDQPSNWFSPLVEDELSFEEQQERFVRFLVGEFRFPRANRYHFEVVFNEMVIGSQTISVVRETL